MSAAKLLQCTFVILLVTSSVIRAQYCPGNQWTEYFDRDDPTVTGDWETLSSLRKENPDKICDLPTNIDARLTNGLPYTQGGDIVTVHRQYGLVCRNELQSDGLCSDYKVRFCCPKCKWTQWYDRDNPSGTGDYETLADLRKKYPGKICAYPAAVDGKVKSGSGNDKITMSRLTGLVCKNKEQADKWCKEYEVRFLCC